MNFLQSLAAEYSAEADDILLDSDEVLDYAIESIQVEIDQVLGFSLAVESNYNHHFSNGDESFENYQSYAKGLSTILTSVGMDVPLEAVVPSFESATDGAGEKKKQNIIMEAAKYVWNLMKKLWNWLGLKKDKTTDEVKKHTETITEAKKVVKEKTSDMKEKKRKVKKTKANPNPSPIPLGLEDAKVANVYASPVIFPTPNKPDFKPLIKQIKNSFAFAAINGEFDTSNLTKMREVVEEGKLKPLPVIPPPITHGDIKLADIDKALDEIDVKVGDEINLKYIKLHKDYYDVIHKFEADIKKLDANGDEVSLKRAEQALMTLVAKDLERCVVALRQIATASKSFMDAVVDNFVW